MKSRLSRGFALPTVMITSVVMLMVMVSAVSSTVAVRVSLDAQYYNQLSKTAGDAGVAYAKACMKANIASPGTPQWSDSKPLMPNTDCKGDQLVGFTCPANSVDPRCSIAVVDGNVIISFSVSALLPDSTGVYSDISSKGSVALLRSSNGSVWRRYDNVVKTAQITTAITETHWKYISTDAGTTCAIASNDQAYCWGRNDYGQLGDNTKVSKSVPTAVNTSGVLNGLTIKSISTGYLSTCAIASNDQAYCWGYNYQGQLGDNTTVNKSVPVAVNTGGALNGLTIKSISVDGTTCAIASDDKAYCWGGNYYGSIGDNTTVNKSVPVAVNTSGALSGLTIKSISVGNTSTCAIASNDKAYCWGQNNYGQLGDNTIVNKWVPVAVNSSGALNGLTIKSISADGLSTCAIASNGQAYCWGWNTFGQLGDNTNVNKSVPVAVNTSGVLNGLNIKMISADGNSACVIASNDRMYCWGINSYGQLGDNTTVNKSVPVAVNTSGALNGLTVKAISVGSNGAYIIASNDQAYSWGNNSSGQLADGSVLPPLVPIGVATDGALSALTVKTISSGSNHSCVVASNNLPYCWGGNRDGQLGDNTTIAKFSPVAVNTGGVLNGLTIKSISAGTHHTCAIASNDQAYCWGYNYYGQLGDNTTVNKSVPVAVNTSGVLNGLTIKFISAGVYYTCAIASNDKTYCWGANSYGQLGDNTTVNKSVPIAVNTSGVLNGLTIKSMSTGAYQACVIASNDLAYCWGGNMSGQLGDNTTVNKSVPVAVNTSGVLNGLTIKSMSVSIGNLSGNESHTCAIASNDKVYCWGNNYYGQLGDNTAVNNKLVPVAVNTSGVFNGSIGIVATGGIHSCAVALSGLSYCWGDNSNGQLGYGGVPYRYTPLGVKTTIGMPLLPPITKDYEY